MPIIGHLGAAASGIYKYFIEKSVRFRSSVNAYLTRTTAQGSTTTMTWSFWYKPSLYSNKTLFGCSLSGSQIEGIGFDLGFGYGSERLHFVCAQGGFIFNILTKRRFRDPTSWYHFVVVLDTTQAVSTDRVRIYVNGTRETEFDVASFPAQNANMWYMNGVYQNYINQLGPNYASYQSDGHLAEVHMLDGYAYGPENFGESVNGTWIPKKYTGAYGANGYYLDFKTGTNLTTLFQDKSGNAKHWTSTNVSLTAGQTYDWSNDTPTSNHCTLNALNNPSGNIITDGALTVSTPSATGSLLTGTQAMLNDKWYCEVTLVTTAGSSAQVGVCLPSNTVFNQSGVFGYYMDGTKYQGGVGTSAYGTSYTSGNTLGIAFDADTGKLWFSKDGVWQASGDPALGTNPAFTGIPVGVAFAIFDVSSSGGSTYAVNFGQRPFLYTPPTNFKSLSTSNLPEPGIAASDPSKHFAIRTHVGTSAVQNVTGVAFQPDFVWIKCRSNARNNVLSDSMRVSSGYPLPLYSDLTNAEGGAGASSFTNTPFLSNGIQLNNADISNASGNTFVDWMWKAGGAAVTNNAGSISSQVSANPAAGFSIVTYTGNGANATVGHGLGVKPKLVIVKMRGGVTNWCVWHDNLTLGNSLYLNLTNGQGADAAVWNSTAPTSSVFSVGTNVATNQNTIQYVAYCFAEVPGFSKIGSYTGNGSTDGPFVDCGFRPKYVMYKRVDATGNWYVEDAVRNPANVVNISLSPNLANVDYNGGGNEIDFLANGFKFRTASAEQNASGGSYIFMAFAEAPFKYANAR